MHRYPTGAYEYGELSLCPAWDDFTLGTPGVGVVMTIFDVTRMLWLARPEHLSDPQMKADVQRLRARVKLWGYFMQDHEGPFGRLTRLSREVLLGYDRILMTSPFGVDVVRATIGDDEANKRDVTFMPHGIWMDTFCPVPREADAKWCCDGKQVVGDDLHNPDCLYHHTNHKPGNPPPEDKDPLEQVVAQMDKYENVKAAVADVERLRAEGKL